MARGSEACQSVVLDESKHTHISKTSHPHDCCNVSLKCRCVSLSQPANGRRPVERASLGRIVAPKGPWMDRGRVIESNTQCISHLSWCHRGHVFRLELALEWRGNVTDATPLSHPVATAVLGHLGT